MVVAYSILRGKGKTYQLTNESTEVPEGSSYLWDFGDSYQSVDENPSHTYKSLGSYDITLTITPPVENGSPVSLKKTIVIHAHTTISPLTVAAIAETHIPTILIAKFQSIKDMMVDKWQLYIQPLVNHDIPEEYYNFEDYYEALENQLIAELVAYEFLLNEIVKDVAGAISGNLSNISGSSSGETKKIVTGPSEAEFFSDSESTAKLTKALEGINKPGGIMDTLRINICQLSARLLITLPMCSALPRPIYPPSTIYQ